MTIYLPDVKDHDNTGDDSTQEVDDGHGGAEHDHVGGRHSRPEHADGHYLNNDRNRIDQETDYDWFRVLGFEKTPKQAANKYEIDEEISLQRRK